MYNPNVSDRILQKSLEVYVNVLYICVMVKGKKDKKKLQMLIHDMDESVYNAVVKLAEEEKRSVGKQAEYMLAKYLETLQKQPHK